MITGIRPAELGDIERLREIEVDAGRRFRSVGLDTIAADDPPTTEILVAHVQSQTVWLAEAVDGSIVGYATCSVVDGEGHLDQVSVIEAAAGHGIGAALVTRVCAWAARRGMASVTLTTFRDVPWNGPYYERLGFVSLVDGEIGPQLAAVRRAERDAGIEVSPRVAMRKSVAT